MVKVSRSSIKNPSWGCLIAVWGNLYEGLRFLPVAGFLFAAHYKPIKQNMHIVFILLSFLAFLGFFAGLIKPSWFKMKSRRQSSGVFAGTFVLLMILTIIASPAEEVPPSVVVQSTAPAVAQPVVATEPVQPPKPKTREELITQKIEASLGATTNTSKPRVVSVELTAYKSSELSTYGYASTNTVQGAFIKTNASENLTSNLQKMTLHKEAAKIFQDTFSSFSQIGDVIIWERLPVSDQYGNQKDDTAIVYAMSRSLYDKINWASFSYTTLPDLLKSEGHTDDRNSYYEAIRF